MKVFIAAAISADGFIARNNREPADWTGTADKKLFVELTKRAGVMIMGRTTYHTINRALPGRQTVVYSRAEDLDLPAGVTRTQEAPQVLIDRLAAEGYDEVAICGGSEIYTLFMNAGVVDEIYLTLEPVLFGAGVPLFNAPLAAQLELLDRRELEPGVQLLHYRVIS